MIDMHGVTMRFKRAPGPLLDRVSLHLRAGEIMPVLGGNGVGKTTLLRLLCGSVLPSEGDIVLAGFDLLSQTKQAQRQIGVSLYPERSFYYRLTCRQNLRYFASLRELFGREARHEVQRVLDEVGLLEQADVPFMRLSLGQRKRLGLARALAGRPPVLILDEPTANLDTESVAAFYQLFRRQAAAGGCVVFSTHQLQDLQVSSGCFLTIEDAQLRASASATDTALTREVQVNARDVELVDLTSLRSRYGLTVDGPRLSARVPVTVSLVEFLAELARLGVVVEEVRDDPWRSAARGLLDQEGVR